MSVTHSATIWCDGEGCGEWRDVSEANSVTASGIRRYLRRNRWAVGLPGGRDFCPDCRAKQNEKNCAENQR